MSTASPGRRLRDAEDARQVLAAIVHSGLSTARWCHEHGVRPGSVYYWRGKLHREGLRKPSSPSSPSVVRVAEVVLPVAAPAPFTLHLPGSLALDIPPSFDAAALQTLLTLLRT